jgi:hypothetical protein
VCDWLLPRGLRESAPNPVGEAGVWVHGLACLCSRRQGGTAEGATCVRCSGDRGAPYPAQRPIVLVVTVGAAGTPGHGIRAVP